MVGIQSNALSTSEQARADAVADAETLWLYAREQPRPKDACLDVIRAANAGRTAHLGRSPKATGRKAGRHAFRAVPGLRG